MLILGIESSCDDTGAAIIEAAADGSVRLLSNIITRQDHRPTGGVVPEVAARHHAAAIIPTVQQALQEANVQPKDLTAIAVTRGPGMIACLLVGVEAAKVLAVSWDKPIVGINHMAGHIASTFVEHPHIAFPALALLVSGGHTMFIGMKDRNSYQLLGNTRDDAAGEAFDKVARLLDLPYPGGPHISRLAEQGNPRAIDFPRPMMYEPNLDFSFAGLKTAVRYYVRDHGPLNDEQKADVAASFQASIIDVIIHKTRRAAEQFGARSVILGGGVSANQSLQQTLIQAGKEDGWEAIIPSPGLFTDNGAMIAIAAIPRVQAGDFDDWKNIPVDPKLKLA